MEQIFLNLLERPWIIALILLWTLPWKAAALWRSARRGHIVWFLILLVLNTLAILDILYIFLFSGWEKETKEHEKLEQKNHDQNRYYPREPKFSSSSRSRGTVI